MDVIKSRILVMRIAGLSNMGKVRQNNEDNFLVLPNLVVVADGMGGEEGGEVASEMVVDQFVISFSRTYRENKLALAEGPDELLKATVMNAHAGIQKAKVENLRLSRMGSTVVAGMFESQYNMFHIVCAGDSRAYRYRGGRLIQLTRDQTYMQALLDEAGRCPTGLLQNFPNKNILTSAVGSQDLRVDYQGISVLPGDLFLFCSDGLHGELSNEQIAGVLAGCATPEQACENLIQAVLQGEARDNVTVAVAMFEESSQSPEVTNSSHIPTWRVVVSKLFSLFKRLLFWRNS